MGQLIDLVEFYRSIGVVDLIDDVPRGWCGGMPKDKPEMAIQIKPPIHSSPFRRSIAPEASVETFKNSRSPLSLSSIVTLEELRKAVESFDGCDLKHMAINTVFSDGDTESPIMFIGEAPGADEDRSGKPFVGVSGQLLNSMMRAIGLKRENVYISNVIFWRPPANRTPSPEEIAACRPFVEQHIAIKAPKLLVLVGGVACSALLRSTSIGVMRGRVHHYTAIDGREIPTIATYHPSFLIRSPRQKNAAWHDWLLIRNELRKVT